MRPKLRRSPAGEPPLSEAAFDALYRDCVGDVHGYALSLLGDRPSAEDVTAQAFERLYRLRSRLDEARGTPRAWLFVIARNAALDELRRRRRQPQLVAEPPALSDDEIQEPGELFARNETIRIALCKLTLREREIVLLKFHGQLTNPELARVLGISQSNAGTRLHRALMHLREHYREIDRLEVA